MENIYSILNDYIGKEIYITYYIFGSVKSKKFTLLSINENLNSINVYNEFEKLGLILPFIGVVTSIVSIRLDSKKNKPIYFNKYIYNKELSNLYIDRESKEEITRTLKK